eukprot:PITA_29402
MIYHPFQQWGLDVIGEITPNSSQQHNYILMAADYFTRWTEAISLQKVNEDEEAILLPNITLPSLQLSQASRGTPLALLQKRINQLVRLEELIDKTINKFRNHQMIVKRWFDHHLVGDKVYQVGELVLKWDKRSEPKCKHVKFQHLWLGPFQVEEKIDQGTYKLKNLHGETEKLPVNGHHLKRYFQ